MQMKRRGLTAEGQTLEGLVSGAEKSQEEFQKVEAGRVVVSLTLFCRAVCTLACSLMPSADSSCELLLDVPKERVEKCGYKKRPLHRTMGVVSGFSSAQIDLMR